MKKISCLFFLLLIVFSLLSEEQMPYPQREFNVHISNGIPNLHPHTSYSADEAQILTALYEGLFVYDPYTLQPTAGIAESWKVTGGSTWRFKIRENACFENGDPITAQTFMDAWFNLLDPDANFPYASLLDCIDGAADYRTGKLKNKRQVGIQVEAEDVLLVYTASPAEHLPSILCHHAFAAVHPSQLEEAGKFLQNQEVMNALKAFKPIASGAYKIESFDDSRIVLVRNENYWDFSFVQVPKIVMHIDLNPEETGDMFNKGELDWIANAGALGYVSAPSAVHLTPMFSTEFFFFKTSAPTVSDPKIRQILLLAVPYDKLREDYIIPAETLILPFPGYPKMQGINEYNIYKAKSMLNEVDLSEEEKNIVIKIPLGEYYNKAAEILAETWRLLGFQVKIITCGYSEYHDSLKDNDYSVGTISWIGDFADPIAFLEMFSKNSSLNNSAWKNQIFEHLIRSSAGEKNIKRRYKLLSDAEKLLLDDFVIIPLSHGTAINMIDLYSISGWYINAINIHPFKYIKFVTPKLLPGIVLNGRGNIDFAD